MNHAFPYIETSIHFCRKRAFNEANARRHLLCARSGSGPRDYHANCIPVSAARVSIGQPACRWTAMENQAFIGANQAI